MNSSSSGSRSSMNNNSTNKKKCGAALQVMLGRDAILLSLLDFMKKHLPMSMLPLLLDAPQEDDANNTTTTTTVRQLLHTTMISPFGEKIPNLQNVYGKSAQPFNNESLSSLVDHVVWSLVQRREQMKRQRQQDGRNVLCQGFVVASEDLVRTGAQSVRNMPSGVVLMQVNNSVEFIKTSPLFQWIHGQLGDNVLRWLLLHCRIFVPIGENNNNNNNKENYLQIAGPPLRLRSKLESSSPSPSLQNYANTKTTKGRKRRRRSQRPSPKVLAKLAPCATIMKNPLLYSNSHVPHVGLPTNHILHSCNPNELLGDLVDLVGTNGKVIKNRWKRLRHQGLEVTGNIIQNHKKCDYARLLEHYCPIANPFCGPNREMADLATVSAGFTPAKHVVSFLKAVLKRVFSENVWGSTTNQNRVMLLVERFVQARRQEHFTNAQLLEGLSIKEMTWLRAAEGPKKFSRSNHDATKQLALLVLRWMLEKFVISLLHSCFHVTETEFAGRQLVYYRKPVWVLFRSLSMKKLLTSQYKEISPSEAAARQEQQRMGFSCLRLVPKKTGIRPIATLSKSVRIVFDDPKVARNTPILEENENEEEPFGMEPFAKRQKTKDFQQTRNVRRWTPSTNSLLNNAFAVLRFEYERDQSLFGKGLDGLHHFYPHYRDFIQSVKPRSNRGVKLYMGSVDVQHCFDSINQKEMLSILACILKERDYCIESHTQFRPFESMSRLLRLKKTTVGRPEDIRPFHDLAQEMAASSHKTVYSDMGNCSVAKCDQLQSLVEEHLKNHLVVTAGRHGSRYLLQSTGVPQGSTLSTLLCNFYYGSIESRLLRDLDDENESPDTKKVVTHLVCRQVDDFLFLGTEFHLLQKYLSALLQGDQSLGIQVNDDKTQVSTTVKVKRGEGVVETLKPVDSRRSFPWCGMLLNVSSGEVMIDYSRFYGDKAGHSISIDRSRGEGEEMLLQLKSFVRPRCIPILFDRCINSPSVQQANLFQLMAFAAVKLLLYIQARGVSMSAEANVTFIVKSIESTISYAGTLVRTRLAAAKAECDICPARHNQIAWKAFKKVLSSWSKAEIVVTAMSLAGFTAEVDAGIDLACQRALRSMHLGRLMPLQQP